jgi:hypothetical protein
MQLLAGIVLVILIVGFIWGLQLAIAELVWYLAPFIFVIFGILLLVGGFTIIGLISLLIGLVLIYIRYLS